MNLIEVMERYPDQEFCIDHLERIRWRGTPVSPHCGCVEIARKKEDGVGRVGRFHCSACNASFKVTCGTVFHGTKIPLQKWFLAIALIVNAKKSLSSHQLSRDLELDIVCQNFGKIGRYISKARGSCGVRPIRIFSEKLGITPRLTFSGIAQF